MMANTSPECKIHIRVEHPSFDISSELAAVRTSIHHGSAGALVSFVGICRDEGSALAALEIEHFAAMAQVAMERLADKAAARWPLLALHIIHRYGMIAPGEEIVLVAAASVHRQAAFAATSWLMDHLKTDAPFWKKQHWRDGRPSDWVINAF